MKHSKNNLTEDIELVEAFIEKGNKEAFGEIYNKYFDDIYAFVYSRVGNKTWTEDIVSETFFTFLEIIKSYNKKFSLKNFIIGISLNKIRQFWAKKYKLGESEFHDEFICIEELEENENKKLKSLSQILKEILPRLTEKYKNVLIERFINQKSIKETSFALNLSEANVRVIQNRALKKAASLANQYLNQTAN